MSLRSLERLLSGLAEKVGQLAAEEEQTTPQWAAELSDTLHAQLTTMKEQFMATEADVQASLETLSTAVDGVATRVSTDLAALGEKIASGASAADLQADLDKINAQVTKLQGIDPASPPVVDPAPSTPAAPAAPSTPAAPADPAPAAPSAPVDSTPAAPADPAPATPSAPTDSTPAAPADPAPAAPSAPVDSTPAAPAAPADPAPATPSAPTDSTPVDSSPAPSTGTPAPSTDTPAPTDVPAPAPADSTTGDSTTTNAPATAPVPTDQAPADSSSSAPSGPSQAVYTYTGSGAPSNDWSVAPFTTSDGQVLYTFDGDTPGTTLATGASAEWQAYTGGTKPANG